MTNHEAEAPKVDVTDTGAQEVSSAKKLFRRGLAGAVGVAVAAGALAGCNDTDANATATETSAAPTIEQTVEVPMNNMTEEQIDEYVGKMAAQKALPEGIVVNWYQVFPELSQDYVDAIMDSVDHGNGDEVYPLLVEAGVVER